MPREFINPNLHVILIHYPLALLSIGAFIEVFGMVFWRRSALRAAGRWMILIGALSMVPTALTGLYAMADVNRTVENYDRPDMKWAEVRAESHVQGHTWDMMQRHAWLNAFAAAGFLLLVVLWLAASDAWRSRLHLIFVLILLGALGVTVWGAWLGGEMVYVHRVAVEPSGDSAEPHDATTESSPTESDWKQRLAFYAPPLQVHVILAGWAIALAFAALGVSLRSNAAAADTTTRYDSNIASAFTPATQVRPALPPHYQTQDPAVTAAMRPPRAPRARFWLLAALFAIGAALTGWWTLAHFADMWDIHSLWSMVMSEADAGGKRRMAHFLTGGGIILLLLVLAIVSRMPVGRRFLVLIFSLALLAAAVGQIWLGSLLMFDSNSGPLGEFNKSETPTTEPAPATTGPTAPVAP